MTKQFTTSKGKFIAMEVPEDAKNIQLVSSLRNPYIGIDCFNSTLIYTFAKDHQGYCHIDGLGIHSKSHPEVLFITITATEDDAKKVVDEDEFYDIEDADLCGDDYESERGYKNYNNQFMYATAIESIHSLLTSLGLDVTKNYAILKVNE
jgi:hypothetical protein